MNLRQYAATQPVKEETKASGPSPLQRELEREEEAKSQALRIAQEYQAAVKATAQAQADISRGILEGLSPYRLLLIATDAIARMTGNTLFGEQTKRDIVLIYGEALGEPEPLRMKLEEVETRLAHLEKYEPTSEDDRSRVATSIRAHRSRIADLKERIAFQEERDRTEREVMAQRAERLKDPKAQEAIAATLAFIGA